MIGHLKAEHLAAALDTAPPLKFAATVVTRFVFERYRQTMTSTVGARMFGGRWNPIGIGALYTSFERETALAEFTRGILSQQPLATAIMGNLIINVERAADFTNTRFCTALGLSLSDLTQGIKDSDYRITQHLGALAYGHPLDALVVPSVARPGGANLVVFSGRNLVPKAIVTAT